MQSSEHPTESDESKRNPKLKSRRAKRRFGMEYKVSDEHWEDCYADRNSVLRELLYPEGKRSWRTHFRWYKTADDRDKAMLTLGKRYFANEKTPMYEYRPIQRL